MRSPFPLNLWPSRHIRQRNSVKAPNFADATSSDSLQLNLGSVPGESTPPSIHEVQEDEIYNCESYAYEDDTVMPATSTGHVKRTPQEDSSGHDDEITRRNTSVACAKWAFVIALVLAGAAVATASYLFTTGQESIRFQHAFQEDATTIVLAFDQQNTNKVWAMFSLAAAYQYAVTPDSDGNNNGGSVSGRSIVNTTNTTATAKTTFSTTTLPNFNQQTLGNLQMSGAVSLFYAPVIPATEQIDWEHYAAGHQQHADVYKKDDAHTRPIEAGIYRLDHNDTPEYDVSSGIKVPIWQIAPSNKKRHLNMFNLNSVLQSLLVVVFQEESNRPHFGHILDPIVANYFRDGGASSLNVSNTSSPRSIALLPIRDGSGTNITGVSGVEIEWISYFRNVVPQSSKICIVLENTCGQVHTYHVEDGIATYVNSGDWHDPTYDNMAQSSTIVRAAADVWDGPADPQDAAFPSPPLIDEVPGQDGACIYNVTVYPTTTYEATFRTSDTNVYILVTLALSLTSILLFIVYGVWLDRRQRQVMDIAAKSNAIIKSLFPEVVRDRLFGETSSHQRMENQGRSVLKNPLGRRLSASHPDGDKLNNPKARLTNFLIKSSPNDADAMVGYHEDEPIAEMFSNTTVMFADIAGFTAWSSEREPSQVFKLLETLYHEFDTIATRLDVFKVETIGDCYVAVSGLPTPNKDHAKVMTRFAHEILLITSQLTQQLEAVLGPGTSDLGLRVGLHSGPVTAGVLRGAKSRFQLFGDTMNTASRMESTGEAGKIQVSDVTADLICKAGKHYWLTKREGTVAAKGKGELQTFWAMVRRAPDKPCEHPISEPKDDALASESETDQPLPPSQQQRELRQYGQIPVDAESITSRYSSFTVKEDRLIDWNVEVLMHFLEKVVHHRLMTEKYNIRFGKFSSKEVPLGVKPRGWQEAEVGGLIIDEVTEVITLPKFNSRYSSPPANSRILPNEIRSQVKEFVAAIASLYREVPFHNFEHASHVTLSANKLMKRIITPDDASKNAETCAADLHFATFGISSDPLTQFAVVFSALIHDVDHTGLSNAQLIKEQATIARIFNNKSVAEQNSVVVAWEILMEPRFSDFQACIFAYESDRKRFRQLVVNTVMATDILDRDMLALRKKRWEKAFDPSLSDGMFLLDVDVNRKATIVIEHIIQASDVAHTMQHWHIFTKWNAKLFMELYKAFLNGHSDQDPRTDWYESQLSFFDNYVIPLANKLKDCGVFGVSGDEYLTYAQLNRSEWEQKGREETRKMILNVHSAIECGLSTCQR